MYITVNMLNVLLKRFEKTAAALCKTQSKKGKNRRNNEGARQSETDSEDRPLIKKEKLAILNNNHTLIYVPYFLKLIEKIIK